MSTYFWVISSIFGSLSEENNAIYIASRDPKCLLILHTPKGTIKMRVNVNHSDGLLDRISTKGRMNQPIKVSLPTNTIFNGVEGLAQLLQLRYYIQIQKKIAWFIRTTYYLWIFIKSATRRALTSTADIGWNILNEDWIEPRRFDIEEATVSEP